MILECVRNEIDQFGFCLPWIEYRTKIEQSYHDLVDTTHTWHWESLDPLASSNRFDLVSDLTRIY